MIHKRGNYSNMQRCCTLKAPVTHTIVQYSTNSLQCAAQTKRTLTPSQIEISSWRTKAQLIWTPAEIHTVSFRTNTIMQGHSQCLLPKGWARGRNRMLTVSLQHLHLPLSLAIPQNLTFVNFISLLYKNVQYINIVLLRQKEKKKQWSVNYIRNVVHFLKED